MKSWDHMKRLSKKSLCAETPREHAETGCKKTLEGPGGSKKGRIKKLLARFGKGFRPPIRPPKQIFKLCSIMAKIRCSIFTTQKFHGPQKAPPCAQEGFFQIRVSWGDVLSTLTKFGPNLTTSISAERIAESWITC